MTEAVRRVRDLPDRWFTKQHTDREVLEAVFGPDWEFTCTPMFPGLSTRFWFLERPGRVMTVSLARDHEIEPYQRGEAPTGPEHRRRWQRHHLLMWIDRADAYRDWATLIESETVARLRRGIPVTPRVVKFFDFWATRAIADPEQRAAVVLMAALDGYANAADLIREHETAAEQDRGPLAGAAR